jgi:hypothetical protein
MIWRIAVIILFGGHQVELVGTEHFNSRIACNEQAVRLTALPIMVPFKVTCISEVHA